MTEPEDIEWDDFFTGEPEVFDYFEEGEVRGTSREGKIWRRWKASGLRVNGFSFIATKDVVQIDAGVSYDEG